MKVVTGNIWTDTDARGVLKIGFTKQYIDNELGECFHVIQADTKLARKGQPLMVLETNDGTSRIRSPINGSIISFSHKAQNFPDRLVEEDVIMEVLPEGVKLEKVVAAKPQKYWNNIQNFVVDDMFAAAPPPPAPVGNVAPREGPMRINVNPAVVRPVRAPRRAR